MSTLPRCPRPRRVAALAVLAALSCDAEEAASLASEPAEDGGAIEALAPAEPAAAIDAIDGANADLVTAAPRPGGAPRPRRAPPEAAPAPPGFTIEEITHGGPGCPDEGSIAAVLLAARRILRVHYDDMRVVHPPGAPIQYTSCTVGLALRVPAGWQVRPTSVDMRGRVRLAEGITARQTTRIFFAGVPVGAAVQNEFDGGADRDYRITRTFPAAAAPWSPCGGSVLLGVEAGLLVDASDDPQGEASLSLWSQRVLGWRWRACQP